MSRIDDSYGSVNTSPQNQRPPGPSLQQQGQSYGPGAGPRFADSPRSFGPSGQPPRRRGRVSRTNTKGGGGQRPDTGEAQAHGGAGPTAAQSRNPQTPKKTSANKSDILSRECFVLEGMGFHQLTISDMVCPEMLGLNGLIDSMYVKLNSTNTYFSKHVTKSVFSYYCCVFAYAHLLRLAQHSGDTLTMAELSFVDFIDGSSFLLPEPLSLFVCLRKDFSLQWHKFTIPASSSLLRRGGWDTRVLRSRERRYPLPLWSLPVPGSIRKTDPGRHGQRRK